MVRRNKRKLKTSIGSGVKLCNAGEQCQSCTVYRNTGCRVKDPGQNNSLGSLGPRTNAAQMLAVHEV